MSSDSETVRVAIVGCGRVAQSHIDAISLHPHLRLVAVADIDPVAIGARSFDHSVRTFESCEAMLRDFAEIDVVVLATPSGLHEVQGRRIVEEFGKSVVIEKPPSLRWSGFQSLVQTARDRGLHVFPVFQYRFNNAVQRTKHAVLSGELGQVRLCTIRQRWCREQRYYEQGRWRGTLSLDGGALTNQGIHHLDLLLYLNGDVEWVNARMRTYGVQIEAEDTAIATIGFVNGSLGTLEVTTAVRPGDLESSISVIGSRGHAIIGGWGTDKLLEFSPRPEDRSEFSEANQSAYGLGHRQIYSGVADTLRGIGEPVVSTDDALKTLRLLHALYSSAHLGREVGLSEGLEFEPLGKRSDALWSVYGE